VAISNIGIIEKVAPGCFLSQTEMFLKEPKKLSHFDQNV